MAKLGRIFAKLHFNLRYAFIEFNYSDIGLEEKPREVEFVWQERTEMLNEFSFDLLPHESILLKIKK